MIRRSPRWTRQLHAKAEDVAGHSATADPKAVDVLVISTKFKAYPGTYAINDGPDFTVAGVPIDTIEYQYSESSERPVATANGLLLRMHQRKQKLGEVPAERYSFPADKTLNGTWYAHVRIKSRIPDVFITIWEYKSTICHLLRNLVRRILVSDARAAVQIDVSNVGGL